MGQNLNMKPSRAPTVSISLDTRCDCFEIHQFFNIIFLDLFIVMSCDSLTFTGNSLVGGKVLLAGGYSILFGHRGIVWCPSTAWATSSCTLQYGHDDLSDPLPQQPSQSGMGPQSKESAWVANFFNSFPSTSMHPIQQFPGLPLGSIDWIFHFDTIWSSTFTTALIYTFDI